MKDNEEIPWELKIASLKDERKKLREFMSLVLPDYPTYAKQYRAYFDALVAAGFKEEQALEIIKAQGWLPK